MNKPQQTLCAHISARSPRKGPDPLDAPLKMGAMEFDQLSLHCLWRETMMRLEVLSKRAREGKALDAGLEFANYVRNAGLIKLCESNPYPQPLAVDAVALRKAVENLAELCRSKMGDGRTRNTVELSEIEKINHKLDLIAAHIANGGQIAAAIPSNVIEFPKAEQG